LYGGDDDGGLEMMVSNIGGNQQLTHPWSVGFANVVSGSSKVNVSPSNEVIVQSDVIDEIRMGEGGKRKEERSRC
jgi:hypothetical protein